MCFSATASFVAGAALSAGGAMTLREARTTAQAPIAAMPLLFGVQQLVEGVVWATVKYPQVQNMAATVYVMFSHALWPTFVPFAAYTLEEKKGWRKNTLAVLLAAGIISSLRLLYRIFSAPVTATLHEYGVQYHVGVTTTTFGLAFYVLLTCFSCFLSSHHYVRSFGVALLASLGIALLAWQASFYSVWCFFAAILSLIIYAHLRHGDVIHPSKKK